jgi:hypothetical protein
MRKILYLLVLLPALIILYSLSTTQSHTAEDSGVEVDHKIEDATPDQIETIYQELPDGVGIYSASSLRSRFHEHAYWVSTVLRGDQLEYGKKAVWLVEGKAFSPVNARPADPLSERLGMSFSIRSTDRWNSEMASVVERLKR